MESKGRARFLATDIIKMGGRNTVWGDILLVRIQWNLSGEANLNFP